MDRNCFGLVTGVEGVEFTWGAETVTKVSGDRLTKVNGGVEVGVECVVGFRAPVPRGCRAGTVCATYTAASAKVASDFTGLCAIVEGQPDCLYCVAGAIL